MENLFITHDTLLCSFLLTHKEISLIEVKEQIEAIERATLREEKYNANYEGGKEFLI